MRRVVGPVVFATVVVWAPAAGAASTAAQRLAAASSGRLPDGPVPAPSGAGIPAPIVILAGFAVLFVLAAVAAGAVRLLGWDPAWAIAWRHSWREAEYRIAGGWLAMGDRFKRQRAGHRSDRGTS